MHFVNAKGILSPQNGMNLYRGCTHGCIYCDSRSRCYHMDHDFEDIEVKENAIELLEKALRSKRKKCMIGTGAMTDPYIPLELELGNVRKALELIYKYGFGVTLQTKSDRILRDLDLLSRINKLTKCVVQMTLTTYDDDLCRKIEPNVCVTSERVRVLKILRDSGIPTVVWLCPILPFINDTEENIAGIMDYCTDAKVYGVICFGMGLTLREGNREYFYRQLDRCFPGLKDRYIYEYGSQYEVRSRNHESLMKLFRDKCDGSGIKYDIEEIFTYLNKFEEKNIGSQMTLWDL
ncbi:radical SAM protein [Mediterraneibacter glycyrrhizinilyticus]|uniref:SPL family radical SAM protein n=1 Tax=Mediterraneibacter glycyrrhizinilyticus TaxID=342942 RepID=UPI0025AA4577|nr:radical SAM protein [Mediterraneibacter glycyrrhizinilyticus]MCF2568504.1 radical SAM protein [Mediterraneibacter glycyrrhizinilyticus]MDN0043267.1 radical SAM protein [Mediterraneibacter glycyrrhizinilyticus]